MTAEDSTPASSTFRRGVLAVLVVVNVGALIALLVLGGLKIADRVGAEPALQSERDAVMGQARDFMTRLNTYGPELLDDQQQMPEYREQLAAMTTAKFGADFEENAPLAEATVAQAGLQRTTTVYSAGVAALDTDRASVLVAGEFTNSYAAEEGSEERVPSDPQPYRVVVTLVKSDGTWLVDGFEPVGGTGAEGEGQ